MFTSSFASAHTETYCPRLPHGNVHRKWRLGRTCGGAPHKYYYDVLRMFSDVLDQPFSLQARQARRLSTLLSAPDVDTLAANGPVLAAALQCMARTGLDFGIPIGEWCGGMHRLQRQRAALATETCSACNSDSVATDRRLIATTTCSACNGDVQRLQCRRAALATETALQPIAG